MRAVDRIEVQELGKKFCPQFRRSLAYATIDILRALLRRPSDPLKLREGEVWALHQVNFTVRRGEALAVLGHNGAGKSTLLKILYGLLPANAGSVRAHGRIVALIELGTGMDPLQTARENVVLVACLHGMSRSAAKSIVADVLAFAELEHVADVVVQSFSTGMRARLAFAIAAMMDADILLVDEVLAVGDLHFQRKCISYLQGFVRSGGTLVLVSHALHQVQAICERAILLEHGEIIAAGETSQIVRRYLEIVYKRFSERPVRQDPAGSCRVEALELLHSSGTVSRSGESAVLRMRIESDEPLTSYCGFTIWTLDGSTCITSSFDRNGRNFSPGSSTIECVIAHLPLIPGRYLARPIVADCTTLEAIPLGGSAGAGEIFDVEGPANLFTNGELQMGQLVAIDAEWNCVPVSQTSALSG